MSTDKAKRPVISIVGPGRFGTALVLQLRKAGWGVECLVVRSSTRVRRDTATLARKVNARVLKLGRAPLPPGLVWLAVPDDVIADVAAQLAQSQSWRGMTVFHSSGALTSDALAPLRRKGAKVASVHPGMTFVGKSVPTLEGVPFGVEGGAAAVRLAKKIVAELGGTAVRVEKQDKILYHAFDSFASPMLIALMAALEQVGKAARIRPADLKAMAGPLLRQTLNNYLEHGAAAAFSGPLIRGDVATIERHLDALREVPLAREAYVALARVAVKNLTVKNRALLEKVIR
jgi:predicted short-subunit dehydrogenase-like oxidoreductase (DUF2520 family)